MRIFVAYGLMTILAIFGTLAIRPWALQDHCKIIIVDFKNVRDFPIEILNGAQLCKNAQFRS